MAEALKPVYKHLMRIEHDVAKLKSHGNRNEVAIRELRDDMMEVKRDIVLLKVQGDHLPPTRKVFWPGTAPHAPAPR